MRARVLVAGVVTAVVTIALLPAVAGAQDGAIRRACPRTVPDSGFTDVTRANVHEPSVDCVVWWELARGVTARRFRPARTVTRGQMATFVAKLILRSGGRLPASPGNLFRDDDASAHHYAINRLAGAGVVTGTGNRFRPDAPVTRAQMASLLVTAYEHRTGRRLQPGEDAFTDDGESVHHDSINAAAAAGFTSGVGGGRFAPGASVPRAQMATFLTRTLQGVADTGQVGRSPATRSAASALEPFDECEDLLGHLKERGIGEVGPYGWSYGGYGGDFVSEPGEGSAGGGDSGGAAPPGEPTGPQDGAAPDYSDTNNQEAGVDESDIVKTDGRTIFTVVDGDLRAVDVTVDPPQLVDSLPLTTTDGAELLLHGGRALVLETDYGEDIDDGPAPALPAPGGGRTASVLTTVDVSDPAALRSEDELRIDGATLTARMVDGVARVVVRSEPPQFDWVYPDHDRTAAQAAAANRALVEDSTIEDWIPTYRHTDAGTGNSTTGPLLGCADLQTPPEYSGLGMVSVVTVDLAGDLDRGSATAVLAGADTVYASTGNLYVATSRWGPWAPEPVTTPQVTTEIHQFAIDDPSAAVYVASGKATGYVLNQFSLSEFDGHLRVATTSQPQWWDDAESDNMVTVLASDGRNLEPVGHVGGLGLGEQIHAVRFLGDLGYVVTFRQTDPLYTLDLSDPTAPRVTGELKILGYSAYLHPVGDGLLLGVGQDATEEGERLGTQLSMFDVSDPANPRRIAQSTLAEGSNSEVEFDHRAFLYWAPTGLTMVPVERWTYDERTGTEDVFIGAVGFDVDPAGAIDQIAEVSHGDPHGDGTWPGIRRSVVVGDTVYTLSQRGMKGSDVTDLSDRSWTGF